MATLTLPTITPVDQALAAQLRARLDGLAKPPRSLGRIEELAVRCGLIQNTLTPTAQRAIVVVFAGDHGLAAEGVSPYPSAVTVSMVQTFLAGRASVNAFAQATQVDVRVVDAGIATDLPARDGFIKAPVRRGTRNALREPALTPDEVHTALAEGADLAGSMAAEGFDILAFGEMGIGNSAIAALLMHRLANIPLEKCVGRGAGHDDVGLQRKLEILQRVADRTTANTALEVLSEFGGCEIAMMAGAILGAAAHQRIVVVDGFISTAAALVAARLNPTALEYCVFSHCSAEQGHVLMLDALQAQPLLKLEMRLGEGTGAVLAVPLIRSAALLLTNVASLNDVLEGRV